ncbi:hypothetical protein GF325_11280 [Candidatus Bathyarchaeota archaeon]|nr:hypothetical protein [Candidatus Bathyarchaeota archaeon]
MVVPEGAQGDNATDPNSDGDGKSMDAPVTTSTSKLWDEIGFHRPIGGFWYKLILEIGILLIPILFVSVMLKYLYPYPTSQGYNKTFTAIFVLVFRLFDIGTSNTISRFIADENIKNPKKMVQYIQYFIWYQMITGLVQITGISAWAIWVVPNTAMAYGTWIILTVVTKQWPGFPGVFKGTLNALQQFNKKATIDFIQGEAFQRITEIAFVLLGRYLGALNPRIGELMGIAIGAVFGLYLDDIIASFLSAYYLSKSLKPYGITFKELFRPDFDLELVKQCTFFGLKTGLPSLLSGTTEFVMLMLALEFIPQYTTFIVLKDMAVQLVALTQRLTDQDFTPIFTEAYQNGKEKLCQYYNAHALRFFAINSGFAIAIMLTVISIFEDLFLGLGLDRYLLTVPFLIPALLYRASRSYNQYPDKILIATGKANQVLALKIFEEVARMSVFTLTIAVFQVQEYGIYGVVYVLTLGDYPAILAKTIIAFIYINRRVFKLKIMPWQTLAVPIMSTAILFSIFWVFKALFLDFLLDFNFYMAIAIGLIFLIVLVLLVYFPITVLLGGWDDNSIRDFKKAIKMAGPSRGIARIIGVGVFNAVKISKLHNRFKYDDTGAVKELKELVETRDQNRLMAGIVTSQE